MATLKKAVLITGALGGLGSALVNELRQLPGINLVVATDIKREIESLYRDDPGVMGLKMDVGLEAELREVRRKLKESGVLVRYLVNNAGISLFHPVSGSTEELLMKTLRVNMVGPILAVQVFLDDLVANTGRVVQVSSDSVRLPTLFQPYPASKIALEAFSISLRQELRLLGVGLVIIRPGAMDTPLVNEMRNVQPLTDTPHFTGAFNRFMQRAQTEVGRRADPARVARLIARALVVKNPRPVYAINKNRTISLVNLLPRRWIDGFICRAVGK